jgi:hypothetical protein
MLRPWKATPFLPLALRARIGEVSRASHWSITLGHFRIQQISRGRSLLQANYRLPAFRR